jgi:hypothetical protein
VNEILDSNRQTHERRLTLYTLNQSLFAFNIRFPKGRRFRPSSESLPDTGSKHLNTLSSCEENKTIGNFNRRYCTRPLTPFFLRYMTSVRPEILPHVKYWTSCLSDNFWWPLGTGAAGFRDGTRASSGYANKVYVK